MAPPRSAAVSRCRHENPIVEHKTNAHRQSLTLGNTGVADMQGLLRNGK